MDLRQLEHFLAVVDTGSLNRASEITNVSQQGMSASIKALETSLNSLLLERGRFGARPTVAGLALAEHARRILGQARLARAEITALDSGKAGVAAMGAGPFFVQHIVPNAILNLAKTRSGITVRAFEATTDSIIRMLLNGEIDFGVSTPSALLDPHPDIVQEILFEDVDAPLVASNHPVARIANPSLRDLRSYPWIYSNTFQGERQRTVEAFLAAGLEPPERMVMTDSLSTVRELLRGGDYIHVSGSWSLNICFDDFVAIPILLPQFTNRRHGVLTKRRETAMPLASRLLMEQVMVAWQDARQLINSQSRDRART